ncbi:hypothetical protein EN836_20700 [Mesorhizobium sp. M1C.F.Ca.ET.193.01.1.1]|uniref:hypothetical protein n=2 Tax=Mesorhizobium TaxID=68287 RepID=UPI001091D483|nr:MULTISPECIES: hypothetical protein [unclassified Mesorhizobium]TGS96539.1 hypothetical protein EN820_41420 [bacterium M00.F.Ca.ET.177.01.1.1]TGQ52269.1 hypothetical protein EN853_20690 [Mesorhizobium sp. M1C.F.Ca.ET.210.01.1.1]TGQ68907.1 hypothetical protein EN855_020700 [Mesorhizobium sp. M1C.F.Ca.ET.212.01.1.1]TGR04259.1 hypothetical protein EN847_20695 [Mesorhizobium sp. M1C.F.Ca.ET.204.01.1.1]TGR24924.1 hypothetical protein EN839_20695 [Mesorhizobium sp. M1C.F.Ca.ET.196.01.1.1]
MRLILHIGTHKTGSTALQHFLSANGEELSEYGFYYASPAGEFNLNSIANAILLDRQDKFKYFLLEKLRKAEQNGAHTIIASSENLYAMARYLTRFNAEKTSAMVLAKERILIERLRAAVPAHVECHVLCYVRRPDHYLESLYNQNVKRDALVAGEAVDFLNMIYDMLDYHRYFSIWRDVFGSSACSVRVYEAALPNLIEDFLRHVLGCEDISSFKQQHVRANERLSRDVLEYKRLRNEHVPYSEQKLEGRIFALVDKRITSPNNNHEYLSPDERAGLLSRLEPSMERLRTEFALPAFPRFSLEAARASWQPYPGLSLEKRREIEFHYNAVQRQIGFRVERLLIQAASLTRGSGIRRLLLEATSLFQ